MSAIRYGRIAISRDMLRLILDRPPWVKIEGAVTTTDDTARGMISLVVSGPFIGDPKGEPVAQLNLGLNRIVSTVPLTRMEPIYHTLDTGRAELRELRGADT